MNNNFCPLPIFWYVDQKEVFHSHKPRNWDDPNLNKILNCKASRRRGVTCDVGLRCTKCYTTKLVPLSNPIKSHLLLQIFLTSLAI